jgi:hypothetical protein
VRVLPPGILMLLVLYRVGFCSVPAARSVVGLLMSICV